MRLNPLTSANKLQWVSATLQRAALMAVGIMIEVDSAMVVKRSVESHSSGLALSTCGSGLKYGLLTSSECAATNIYVSIQLVSQSAHIVTYSYVI